MTLSIELTDEQAHLLQLKADELNISTEQLAVIAVQQLLLAKDEKFQQMLKSVLDENEELYKRLA